MTKTNTDAVTNGVTNTAAAKPNRRRKSEPKAAKAKDEPGKRKPSRER